MLICLNGIQQSWLHPFFFTARQKLSAFVSLPLQGKVKVVIKNKKHLMFLVICNLTDGLLVYIPAA